MTREEARLVLAGYRPNGVDATDPRFAEALAVARQDPELAAWFRNEQKFDSAISDKLGALRPPPTLRSEILLSLRFRPPRVARHWWLAAAVLVLFCVTAGAIRWRTGSVTNAEEADLVMFAVNYAANGITLQKESGDSHALRAWLATQHAPLPDRWPVGLAALRSLGCRTLNFKGRAVSLICFGQEREFHLFVARRADFPQMRMATTPRAHAGAGGWSSAAWADADYCFVLVSEAPSSELQRYLPTTRALSLNTRHRPARASTIARTL